MGAKVTPDQRTLAEGLVEQHFVSAKSGTTTGKAQPLSEPVLTPDGFRLMEAIKEGSYVIDADGLPTKVLGVYPQGEQEIYEVQFSDGTSTRCTLDHLWLTQTFNERKHKEKQVFSIKTLGQIKATLWRYDGQRNHVVPNNAPVEFAAREVRVDPYVFGVLLGDGCFRNDNMALSTADEFILQEVSSRLPSDCAIKHISAYDYRLNGFTKYLRGYGCLDKLSCEKYIHDDYKYNSVAVRLEVIRGLMDADGTLDYRTGDSPYLCTTSSKLADDFAWLVRSVGGFAQIKKKKTAYTYKDDWFGGRLAYYVYIVLPYGANPFKLPRKATVYRVPKKYTGKKFITKITSVGVEQCQCIAVESASELYLTKDFIVTHNTTCAATVALWFLTTRVEAKIVCTAPTGHQLEDLLFAEMESWIRRIKFGPMKKAIKVIKDKIYIDGFRDWFIVARTIPKDAKDKLGDVLAGFHAPSLLFIVDEASGVPDPVFAGIEGSMIQKNVFCLLVGNPTRANGFFFDTHNKNKKSWCNVTLSSLNSPFVDQEWVERMKNLYGEDSDWYRTKVLGEFPLGTGSVVATYDQIELAFNRHLVFDKSSIEGTLKVAGLDPGAGHGDLSILTPRQGRYVHKPYRIKHTDTVDLVKKVTDICLNESIRELYVDYIGLGISIFDHLRVKQGFRTYKVIANARANDPDAYRNVRAELYKQLSDNFDELALPDEDRYVQELPEIPFIPDSRPLQVVEKKQIKNRLGFSPDYSDSLMLSTYRHFDLGREEFIGNPYEAFMQINSNLIKESSFVRI